MYVITIHFEKSHPKTFIAIHINYTTTNNDHFEKKCYRETLEERDMDIHATNTNISTAANTTTILPDDEDDDEHLWEHETATLNPNTPMHDPDRLLMYNKANYDDDYDDENDDAEEEDFHAKSHSCMLPALRLCLRWVGWDTWHINLSWTTMMKSMMLLPL